MNEEDTNSQRDLIISQRLTLSQWEGKAQTPQAGLTDLADVCAAFDANLYSELCSIVCVPSHVCFRSGHVCAGYGYHKPVVSIQVL